MSLARLAVLLPLLGSCALIDGLSGSEDEGPLPDVDAGVVPQNCMQTEFVGDIGGIGTVGPFNSCATGTPLNLSDSCGGNNNAGSGIVLEFVVSQSIMHIICASSPAVSHFVVESGFCSETPFGQCIDTGGGNGTFCAEQVLAADMEHHFYWEPLQAPCAMVTLDVTPSM